MNNSIMITWIAGMTLVSIAGASICFVLIYRRLIARGWGWSIPLFLLAGAYYLSGAFLSSVICGFDTWTEASSGPYQEICIGILAPAAIVMFISSGAFPVPLPYMLAGGSIATVLAAIYVLADLIYKKVRA